MITKEKMFKEVRQRIPSSLPVNTYLQSNKFKIGRFLGHGGFGITYGAWHRLLDEPVAIKEFFPNKIAGRYSDGKSIVPLNRNQHDGEELKWMRTRFLQEGKNLSNLPIHKNIVKIKDVFEENKTVYLVMEYLDGITLKEYMNRSGFPNIDTAITVMLEILEGVEHIHRHRFMHRDIKPNNIIITKSKEIKIVDFGATRRDDHDFESIPIVAEGYSPLEQYYQSQKQFIEQTYATDIYACGATLYSMLTGKVPVSSFKRFTALKGGMADPIIPVRQLRPDCPQWLNDAIMRALELYPQKRPQSVNEWRNMLDSSRTVPLPFPKSPDPPSPAPAPSPWKPDPPIPTQTLVKAKIFPRFFAYVLDIVVLSFIVGIIGYGVFLASPYAVADLALNPVVPVGLILLFALKDGYNGRSPGKMLMELATFQIESNQPTSFYQSFIRSLPLIIISILRMLIDPNLRSVLEYIAGLMFLIDGILIVSTQKGQKIGDLLAHTQVINDRNVVL